MKTIEQQAGWKRPFPQMICQDQEVLEAVTEHSFDLDAPGFIDYFRSRTGVCIGNEEKPALARFCLTDPDAEEWLLKSPDFKYLPGEMVPFGKDREIQVKCNRIMKGKLQDCWELFVAQEKVEAPAPTGNHKAALKMVQGDLFAA